MWSWIFGGNNKEQGKLMKSNRILCQYSLLLFLFLVFPILGFAQDSFYQEAPMLAERVTKGELPPVEERLPKNPVLITPHDDLGVYGGTWNLAMINKDRTGFLRIVGFENLVRWNPNWTEVIPNIAQSYEVSDDATTFTFRLRQGMRWSDGVPFTADDIVFWYEAVLNNLELTPNGNGGLIVEKLADNEVRFRFNNQQGLFLQDQSTFGGVDVTRFPKHYASQFHPDYNPNVEQLASETGFSNWVELWNLKTDRISVGMPTLNAWMVETARFEANTEGEAIVRAVRNPYYWKIDTEFNQLPYIDVVEFKVVSTLDEVSAMALAGEIDMQDRNIHPSLSFPENQAIGGYGLYTLSPSFSNYMAISFNQTHTDLIKRQLFQNRDFRIGMSHALNRLAMIDASGLDVHPVQVAPLKGTPWYSERMATQYLEYDVDLANDYLNRVGYSQRDTEGFRLGIDGERISITIMVADPTPSVDYNLYLPQIEADWEAVGIEVDVELVPRVDYEVRSYANDFDVAIFLGEGGLDTLQAPRNFIPVLPPWSQQGILWADWYDGLPSGEEPPSPVLEAITLYRQVLQTGDIEQQVDLMKQIISIMEEEFHVMGIHEVPLTYGIIRPNFHNVPKFSFFSSNYPNPSPTNPSQYFIDPIND